MPNLSRFIERGVMGNIASLIPCLTPMLWTSVATGRTADEHGILGFVEPREDGLGVVPSRSSSRRSKALWNILDESGLKSGVVAWPVSDPAESISGVYVSERMCDSLADRLEEIAPVPHGCVHPATLEPFVSELRLHPCELLPGDLSGMIPEVSSIDLTQDSRPALLARIFARCASVHAVATAAMEAEPWDFFAVYYDAIDRAGHDFMTYRAPQMEHVSEQDFQHYRHVVDGVYEFHDAMLGRLMELAGEDTTVVLMSDHGFQSGNRRPAVQERPGTIPAEGADWHRMLGVFAMKGPGIKRDERIYGASLLDIAPTILTLFGLRVGRDMSGRVLTGAFLETPKIRWIDSWEAAGHLADRQLAEEQSPPPSLAGLGAREASVRQLAALGYVGADAVEGAQAARIAEQEALFNLGTVHLNHGRPAAALALFQRLCDRWPLHPRYEYARAFALSRLARHQEVLTEVERLEAAGYVSAQFDLLAAAALAAGRRGEAALERLESAAAREPANPVVHQVAGDFHLARGRIDEAKAFYAKTIALDPDNAQAYSGMSQANLDTGDFEDAAECALTSLQQAFWNPVAQFRLGQAMTGLGKRAEAQRAFEHAVEQAPSYGEAHYRLAVMFEEDGDYLRAVAHRQRAVGFVKVNS
jgi:tetratricopeptide (TPR) repeat protein